MITKPFIYFHKRPSGVKAAITAGFAIIVFGIGAFMENRIQLIAGDQPGDLQKGIFWSLIATMFAIVWGSAVYFYYWIVATHSKNLQAQERAIADARERINKLSIQHLTRCDAIIENREFSMDKLRSVLICEIDRVAELVTAAYEVINSHHNGSSTTTERINFELTLITPSICDSELTIAAWCNRDNRRPKSLLLRENDNVNIYRRTEAAKMISNRVTDTIVIKDTSAPTTNYESLYEGQKARIRSSVLHPILSPKSEHLAILVLHCERANFFQDNDRRYWHELFSVFAPAIALELERIKAFNKANSAWPVEPPKKYEPY